MNRVLTLICMSLIMHGVMIEDMDWFSGQLGQSVGTGQSQGGLTPVMVIVNLLESIMKLNKIFSGFQPLIILKHMHNLETLQNQWTILCLVSLGSMRDQTQRVVNNQCLIGLLLLNVA